jgi:alginate O-acetyltransferase complex protein AlgI
VITFFAVVVAMVLFRSPSVHVAADVYRGMLGLNGIELPPAMAAKLGGAHHHVAAAAMSTLYFAQQQLWMLALLCIALLLPNTVQIMARFEPVLGAKERPADTGLWLRTLSWNPTLVWAIGIAALAAAAVMRVGGPSEFLYWQF